MWCNALKTWVSSFLAGAFIAIGAACNLYLGSIGYAWLGAFVFPIGLLRVCFFDKALYTGKVGFILENDFHYFVSLFNILFGNCVGALMFGVRFSCRFPLRGDQYYAFINAKFLSWNANVLITALVKGMMAGVFVFLAVKSYKTFNNAGLKALFIILNIAAMVLLKSDHCIANVAYFGMLLPYMQADFLTIIISFIFNCLTNAMGSIIMYLLFEFRKCQD